MIPIITNEFGTYPEFQASGNAARFAIPYAQEVCIGEGYDIGGNSARWSFPGALIIDPALDPKYDAFHLPINERGGFKQVDYIFSSHCLEHLPDWVKALDIWTRALKPGGVLFLYLPHYEQVYWRPWNNRKHVNVLTGEIIRDYLEARGYENIWISGIDLNHSFMVMAEWNGRR